MPTSLRDVSTLMVDTTAVSTAALELEAAYQLINVKIQFHDLILLLPLLFFHGPLHVISCSNGSLLLPEADKSRLDPLSK